jgi:hypothetical protein
VQSSKRNSLANQLSNKDTQTMFTANENATQALAIVGSLFVSALAFATAIVPATPGLTMLA